MDLKTGSRKVEVILIAVTIITVVGMIIVSSIRPLSPLENVLFQILILSAGLAGSYLFGRQSAQLAAQEMVKPAARSAFRRVLGLYASLSRLAERLQIFREGASTGSQELEIVEVLVREQLSSVTDAMEDWRDLVPEDVKDVERRLEARAGVEEFIDD